MSAIASVTALMWLAAALTLLELRGLNSLAAYQGSQKCRKRFSKYYPLSNTAGEEQLVSTSIIQAIALSAILTVWGKDSRSTSFWLNRY